MKKLLGIVVLGLLCFNSNAIAEEHKFKSKDIKGFKKIRISMHNKKVNRINQVKKSDGFPVYEGDTSIQITVNREDAGCGDGTSKDLECDGKGNRSRQELTFDIKKKLNNKEHIYEYAIYFDKSYESLEKRAVVILGQHHTQKYNVKGCHSCCNFWLADTIYKGEHKYTWQSKSASNVDPVVIGKIEDLKGKWTHIKLHVLWKKDGTGRFIIYKNKEVIADLKDIKTLADTCNSGYLKLGIYRHNTIGYWNSDWESLPDQTVYYDNIVFRKPKKDEKIKNK